MKRYSVDVIKRAYNRISVDWERFERRLQVADLEVRSEAAMQEFDSLIASTPVVDGTPASVAAYLKHQDKITVVLKLQDKLDKEWSALHDERRKT